jgi:hypothetical protein
LNVECSLFVAAKTRDRRFCHGETASAEQVALAISPGNLSIVRSVYSHRTRTSVRGTQKLGSYSMDPFERELVKFIGAGLENVSEFSCPGHVQNPMG